MFFCIEVVENPLVFIRDRLDSQIKLQREGFEQKMRAGTDEASGEDKSESNEREQDEEAAAGSSETVISPDCAAEVDVDPDSGNAEENADVSDSPMIEEPKLQTIIEKDEVEAQPPIATDHDYTSAATPSESVQKEPEDAEQTAASESALIPGEEEPSMPSDVINDNIFFEMGKNVLENVLSKVERTIEIDEDDQPDSDEAVPYYDAPEEVEVAQLEQVIKVGEVEVTLEMEEEQKEDDGKEDVLPEIKQEPEEEQVEEEQVEEEQDQLDSQCISAPQDSAGVEADDATTSESALYDETSAENAADLKALETVVSKRKLSILPDDAETVYLLSKSFKLDPDTPSKCSTN